MLIGGSVGETGEAVPGSRKVVGAPVLLTGGNDSTGAGVASSEVGDSVSMAGIGVGLGIILPSDVGAGVSSLFDGAGVSPTGSGVIFIMVGMGVGRD